MIIKKNTNIVLRKIHGSFFLVDISDDYSGDKCALYEVNETGMFIWNCINNIRSANDIAMLLKEAIVDDVDYTVIYKDVLEFLNTLRLKHFVEVC